MMAKKRMFAHGEKSQLIRECIQTNPTATPTEVVSALAEDGVPVGISDVYRVKAQSKKVPKVKKKRGFSAASEAKKLAKAAKGERLQRMRAEVQGDLDSTQAGQSLEKAFNIWLQIPSNGLCLRLESEDASKEAGTLLASQDGLVFHRSNSSPTKMVSWRRLAMLFETDILHPIEGE